MSQAVMDEILGKWKAQGQWMDPGTVRTDIGPQAHGYYGERPGYIAGADASYYGGPGGAPVGMLGWEGGQAPQAPALQQNTPAPMQQNMFGSQLPDMGIPTGGGQGGMQPAMPGGMTPYGPPMGQGGTQPGYMQTGQPNPYLGGMADDMSRRMGDFLQSNLSGIRSNAILAGGYGGSRQGLAEGKAISGAADAFTGQMANMFGSAYNNDQNRSLQRYQGDQQYDLGSYANQTGRLGTAGGLMNNAFGLDTQRMGTMGGLDNQRYGMDQSFYTQQRGQDQTQLALGASLAQQGMQTPWTPIQNANSTYSPYTGFGSTTQGGQTGGGWQGALGGALGGAQLGKNMGWW